jgi:hypothetical protein
VWTQAKILAFQQLKEYDEMEFQKALAGATDKPGRR